MQLAKQTGWLACESNFVNCCCWLLIIFRWQRREDDEEKRLASVRESMLYLSPPSWEQIVIKSLECNEEYTFPVAQFVQPFPRLGSEALFGTEWPRWSVNLALIRRFVCNLSTTKHFMNALLMLYSFNLDKVCQFSSNTESCWRIVSHIHTPASARGSAWVSVRWTTKQ